VRVRMRMRGEERWEADAFQVALRSHLGPDDQLEVMDVGGPSPHSASRTVDFEDHLRVASRIELDSRVRRKRIC